MKIEIKSGKYKLIESGLVFIPREENSIEFKINAHEEFAFNVSLEFLEEGTGDKNLAVETSGNNIKFKCINFKDSGTGTTEELELATVNGKRVCMNFWSYKMTPKSPRKIEYSIYQEV